MTIAVKLLTAELLGTLISAHFFMIKLFAAYYFI